MMEILAGRFMKYRIMLLRSPYSFTATLNDDNDVK